MATSSTTIVVVDGNNVIGTVPDGWWRDRRAATYRLLARLQCLHARTGSELVLVLDVVDPELPEGEHSDVAVRYATRRGRDGRRRPYPRTRRRA
jgi:hypothetical protein